MRGPASSTTAEIYMQAYERTAITTALHPSKVWERFVDDVYSILKHTHLENVYHDINNLHQNIKFTIQEESNGELAFLETRLKRHNGEISFFFSILYFTTIYNARMKIYNCNIDNIFTH